MESPLPSISVVVEWENTKTSELARARAMLSTLFGQMHRLSNRFSAAPELILVHDADHGAADQVLSQLKDELATFHGSVNVVEASGLDYYDQKNLGASHARNELILFVDSDIVPEEGWLEALMEAMILEGADVSAGLTHVTKDSFYDKAFASFWFFPVAGEIKGRHVADGFAANNVLFRAKVAKENPFPDNGQVRGRCLSLAENLVASGHKIVLEPEARVSHPPPNGMSHFFRRALCQGYDNRIGRDVGGRLVTLRQFYWDMRRSRARISANYRNVGLTATQSLGALAIAFTYYGIAFLGELVTFVSPTLIRDQVRV